MIISISNGFPGKPFKEIQHPLAAAPRFGRDALFERNARFETPREKPKSGLMTLLKRTLGSLLGSKSRPSSTQKPSNSPLCNEQGRIPGKSVVNAALNKAAAEYVHWKHQAGVSPYVLAMAGIRLANAQLAADVDNSRAFRLLKASLKSLHDQGFPAKTDSIPPEYVHGLYNRGCYVFNNDLYHYTAARFGKVDMEFNDAAHEGLALLVPEDKDTREVLRQGLKEGLPYLEMAIALAPTIPDHQIALVEYLTAKGEVLHALSHFYTAWPLVKKDYDQQGLAAFQDALKVVDSIDSSHYNSRHFRLAQQLQGTKIPHICSHRHQTEQAQPLCAQLYEQGMALINQFQRSGVAPPPKTRMEQLAELLANLQEKPL